MKTGRRVACLAFALSGLAAGQAGGQGYLLRLDARLQSVAFRGVHLDSIRTADTVGGPGGGRGTSDGFAVTCPPASDYCFFYRPGDRLRSAPLVSSADLTFWGLGVPGLVLRGNARWSTDLGREDAWPGTRPALQLLEAYAEYARAGVTGRLGRQHVTGRLGWTGIDGGAVVIRPSRTGFDLTGYAGWGLARGLDVPITSPSLNPLDDFQLTRRQVTAGAAAGWRGVVADLRAEYRIEIDPSVDRFVSERAALTAVLHPATRLTITGGAEYDLAQGWWGTSDLRARYGGPMLSVDAGVRRYRPYFELWTIWGAFSPVPYTAVDGFLSIAPLKRLRLRVGGERYWFDEHGAETALATFEDRGWRATMAATALVSPTLTVDAGYHEEFGPGAALRSWDARASWVPSRRWSVSAFGSTLTRPLEFRFDEAQVDGVGADAVFRLADRMQVAAGIAQYFEHRRRPDAGALDWNQLRVHARVTWAFGSDADRLRLPPALRGAGRRASR